MKILVLTSTYARRPNDTEPKFVDNLCQFLKAQGNEIHVLAPHATGIPTREAMQGIEVIRFRYCLERWETLAYDGGILPSLKENRLRFLLIPLFMLGQLVAAIKLMRSESFDLVHAHWIIPQGLVAVLATTLAGSQAPIVLTSHGGDLFALKGKLLTRLKKWVIDRCNALTVVSSAMKEKALLEGLVQEQKVSVIPMGVDSRDMFRPSPAGTPKHGLLFVGRLVDKKGIEYLIKALPTVLAKHPETRLTIVGDGPLRKTLENLSEEEGAGEAITFAGSVANPEIPGLLQQALISIFPSIVTESGDQEGTPVAIMEALACASAAIVADYPGVRDIIIDGETGMLVPQRSAQGLAAAISHLLGHPDEIERLGHNGREIVEMVYDWRVVSARFSEVFDASVPRAADAQS